MKKLLLIALFLMLIPLTVQAAGLAALAASADCDPADHIIIEEASVDGVKIFKVSGDIIPNGPFYFFDYLDAASEAAVFATDYRLDCARQKQAELRKKQDQILMWIRWRSVFPTWEKVK